MAERHLVYSARKFQVERMRVPVAGAVVDYDVVVHPGAAVVLPVLPDGRILLIRNRRVAVDAELLELPAGTLDPGEPPAVCAARELEEETGYTAAEVTPLIWFYASPGFCTEKMHLFVARGLSEGPARPEPGEQIRKAPMPLDDALAAISRGEICDGKSIVALLYFDRTRRAAGASR